MHRVSFRGASGASHVPGSVSSRARTSPTSAAAAIASSSSSSSWSSSSSASPRSAVLSGRVSPSRANSNSKKVYIVAGASAEVAKPLMALALERGYIVRALTTSNKEQPKDTDLQKFRYVNVKVTDYHDAEKMRRILENEVADVQPDEIYGVVLIGGANPPSGISLDQMNVTPLQTTSTAISEVGKGTKKTGMVYLSSVAATHVREHCSYAQSRARADQWLVDSSRHDIAVSLRSGIVIDDPRETGSLMSKHQYSIDQVVNFPLVTPVMGSGDQICEALIVYDLVHAALNTLESPEELREVVNAVTRHQYTQLELLNLYAKAMGRKIRPFHIHPDFADVVGTHFPLGRLASYSAKIFKHRDNPNSQPLCHQRFEQLLARDPTSLEDVLLRQDNEAFLSTRSPLPEHMMKIFKKCAKDREARRALTSGIRTHGVGLLKEFSRSLTS